MPLKVFQKRRIFFCVVLTSLATLSCSPVIFLHHVLIKIIAYWNKFQIVRVWPFQLKNCWYCIISDKDCSLWNRPRKGFVARHSKNMIVSRVNVVKTDFQRHTTRSRIIRFSFFWPRALLRGPKKALLLLSLLLFLMLLAWKHEQKKFQMEQKMFSKFFFTNLKKCY